MVTKLNVVNQIVFNFYFLHKIDRSYILFLICIQMKNSAFDTLLLLI